MTTLLRFLVLLPGRLTIKLVDRPYGAHGRGPLGRFTRGCVHVFVWLVVLIAFSVATMSPAPAPAVAAPPVKVRPAPVTDLPQPIPTTSQPVPTSAPSAPVDVDYVPLPDDDDDWDKPRICHRKWWC